MSNDGGSAFPCMPPQDTASGVAVGYPFPESGMTLRDYFAAKAMQGIICSIDEQTNQSWPTHDMRAEFAYGQADAMLKARQQ